MSATEAISEAKRRWGTTACIHNTDAVERCAIGLDTLGLFTILGRGATWEQALADADGTSRRRRPRAP